MASKRRLALAGQQFGDSEVQPQEREKEKEKAFHGFRQEDSPAQWLALCRELACELQWPLFVCRQPNRNPSYLWPGVGDGLCP